MDSRWKRVNYFDCYFISYVKLIHCYELTQKLGLKYVKIYDPVYVPLSADV